MSADYQKHYGEPLPIYVAVDLAQPPKPKVPQPAPPKIPGLMPGDDIPQAVLGPEAVETSVAVRAPIIELLRYFTALGGVSYTVRNDIILIHAANK